MAVFRRSKASMIVLADNSPLTDDDDDDERGLVCVVDKWLLF
jgi:hypothetical protein